MVDKNKQEQRAGLALSKLFPGVSDSSHLGYLPPEQDDSRQDPRQDKQRKKKDGPSFCHWCNLQLQYKKGGGFYFTSLLTPVDNHLVRVHMTQCAPLALSDGYKNPNG